MTIAELEQRRIKASAGILNVIQKIASTIDGHTQANDSNNNIKAMAIASLAKSFGQINPDQCPKN